jgi:uncharacterized OsmC-like protein
LTGHLASGPLKPCFRPVSQKVEGVLERPERTTYFTTFNVHAVLHAPEGAKVELAERLLEKAEALCLITASLKSDVVLTTEIILD